MSRAGHRLVLAALLIFNASAAYATDAMLNTLPVIERQVVTLSSVKEASTSILIPRTALTTRNAIPGVFVVENNEARFRMVRPGKSGAARVEILSGLFGNETLIISELQAVHDGSPVKVVATSSGKK